MTRNPFARPLAATLSAVAVGLLGLSGLTGIGAHAEHLEDTGFEEAPAAGATALPEASAADELTGAGPVASDDDDDTAASDDPVIDLLDDVVPTDPAAPACPAGLAPVLYQGVPVTNADGSPVCVTPAGDGQAGEAVPGQRGEDGQASDSEGVVDPGGLGEDPAP